MDKIMLSRVKNLYREYPSKFWLVVAVSFIDRTGGTMLFPFFSLYITWKFNVGMTQAGIVLGIFATFGRWGVNRQIWPAQAYHLWSGFQRAEHAFTGLCHRIEGALSSGCYHRTPVQYCRTGPSSDDCRHFTGKAAG